MSNNNENENADISKNSEISGPNKDNISTLLNNEQDFVSIIKKLLESEFEELFPKILNLPKIDFLNQLTSNVSYILSEQFSPKIFDDDKCMSLITSVCRSFDKIYNKYMEELSEGWDKYNFEKMNQIQNPLNENIESFLLTKFRKHCHKTQNYAIHQCNKEGKTGTFIIVYGFSSSQSYNDDSNSKEINKNKMKYLICDNCRKSFFIHEFKNYCEFCKTSYLCGPLIKDENENLLPASLNPPHCETFVNDELLCEKCKNKLYIDINNNKLICGNKNCDYSEEIENNKKINFKCKLCHNNFDSNVKIYNPLELVHFKDIIKKALLYKRKAYPGKLSCCREIKEKRTDFYHKKDCKGNLYFAEYNHKIIIICSKCKAVNLYSKFIWTCPECGLHFRDKKSEENEIKIRKTKSSNKLFKAQKLFPNFEDENSLTINNNKRSFAEILNKRKIRYEKSSLYNSYSKYDSNTERKRNPKINLLSEKKLNETDNSINSIEKSGKISEVEKKKKRMYIIGKIFPFRTPRKHSIDNSEENQNNSNNNSNKKEINDNENNENNYEKKEYYDKKVNDLINPKEILTENSSNKNLKEEEEENHMFICKSGRIHFKYNDNIDENKNNDFINNGKKKIKEKKIHVRNFNAYDSKSNYDSVKNTETVNEEIIDNNYQTPIDLNCTFNKKKSPGVKNVKKDNDLKCKKFIPIKLNYLNNNEKTIENEINQEKNNENTNYCSNNNNINRNRKILNLFQSQRIKKPNLIDFKKNIISQAKNIEDNSNNNKESWKTEATTKGSIESKNSVFSHSPPKEEIIEEENKKINRNSLFINNNNSNNNNNNNNNDIIIVKNKEIDEIKRIEKEDDIIPFEMVNIEEEITIESKNIKDDKNLYNTLQRRLKRILIKGKLPRFDLDKYSIDKQIGDGSFGVIYLVHHNKSKRKYAMKKILANNINSLELFQKEFEIAYNNPHPSILNIKGIYLKCFDSTTFVLYVLMDLAEKDWEVEINDRQKYKKYYREKELISILKQLSSALFFLQKEKNVAHRDIKPENVLIFKNKSELLYKLCDFGEAKDYAKIHSRKNKTLRGTELYMSPALYNGLLHEAIYVNHDAYKSDVFSLGCCMIIAANLDFDIINEIRELKEQNKIADFLNKKLSGKYSEKFIDIILKMINFNEKERIDFIQLEQIIESTF